MWSVGKVVIYIRFVATFGKQNLGRPLKTTFFVASLDSLVTTFIMDSESIVKFSREILIQFPIEKRNMKLELESFIY